MAPTKRTTSPAFQIYPKEFLSSTKVIAMSMTERGIYITLLFMQWLDGGLPTDLRILAKLVGLPPKQFMRMWPHNLARCFKLKNGAFVNERLEKERKKQLDYREKQRNAAAMRWDKKATPKPDAGIPATDGLGNALRIPFASPSPSPDVPPPKNGGGTARGMAPIHDTSHKKHVHCGRICVHSSQHDAFVRRRNHLQADKELRDFYSEIEAIWATPPFDTQEPGDPFDFWRERYAERWPAAAKAAPRRPAEQQPEYTEWVCPHVEEHLSRWRCDQATQLNKPRKVSA